MAIIAAHQDVVDDIDMKSLCESSLVPMIQDYLLLDTLLNQDLLYVDICSAKFSNSTFMIDDCFIDWVWFSCYLVTSIALLWEIQEFVY